MAGEFEARAAGGRDVDWASVMPRYNVAPTDQVPVVYQKNGVRLVQPMRWGLVPYRTAGMRGRTALDSKGKSIRTPINARAETVHSHGFFKNYR
jgi:putative SOS response-associated peptidase YedK